MILFFVAGGLFGTGLAVSGMTDPARVIGFLDLLRVGSGTPLRHGRGRWRVWIGNTDAAPREKSGFEAALSYTVAH